jgi:4-hydroxybenzoate polyprenyltransferase
MPAQIMAAVPVSETAAANGLNAFMRSFGTATAAAVVGAILAAATPATIIDSFGTVYVLGLIAAVTCAVLAFMVPHGRNPEDVAVPAAA